MPSAGAASRPLVLGIDTCTDRLGLALVENRRDVVSVQIDSRGRHTETLLPELAALLDRAGRRVTEIGLLGVTIGPGRFTSLRIGLATAQGLAVALGVRIVPVSAHEAIAWSAAASVASVAIEAASAAPEPAGPSTRWLLVPVLDGGGGVFGSVLEIEIARGAAFPEDRARLRGRTAFRSLLVPAFRDPAPFCGEICALAADRARGPQPRIGVAGSGAPRVVESLERSGLAARSLAWDQIGAWVASLAEERSADAVDAADLEPVYLRPSQAEDRRGSAHRALDRTDAA